MEVIELITEEQMEQLLSEERRYEEAHKDAIDRQWSKVCENTLVYYICSYAFSYKLFFYFSFFFAGGKASAAREHPNGENPKANR